jgi:hypothetical protein
VKIRSAGNGIFPYSVNGSFTAKPPLVEGVFRVEPKK